jgi:cytochrome b6-f complex iron-sulfur subunit
MNRKEFLAVVGVAACGVCLSSCMPQDQITAPTNVDFTLDLTKGGSQIASAGTYMYNGGVIIAHLNNGSFVALSQACTHAGSTVTYDKTNNVFSCSAHGSVFSTNGSVINGPASSPLQKYNTTLSGNALRVFS